MLHTARTFADAKGLPQPLPRELEKQVLAEYRVEPGDVLTVEQADFDASIRLPGDQTVRADGTIDLGTYGRISVVGLTLDEITDAVQRRIERQVEKTGPDDSRSEQADKSRPVSVDVRLVEAVSKVYYVVGEVKSPGAFPLAGRETVLDAIFAAGDLTDRADRHGIILSRPSSPGQCRVVLPICYRHIVQLGDTSTNYQILPGDRIYVPSLTFWDELYRFFVPTADETCPRCSGCQIPCPDGVSNIEFVD